MNKEIGFSKSITFMLTAFLYFSTFLPGLAAAADAEVDPLDLNDTKWELKMVGTDAKGKKKEKSDTLIFEKDTVIAESFQKKGFAATNYSVLVEEDGTTTLSTMQVSSKETAFWKADVSPGTDRISGKVNITPATGTPEQYIFDGKLIQGIVMTKTQKEAAAIAAAEAAAAEAAARKAEAARAASGGGTPTIK